MAISLLFLFFAVSSCYKPIVFIHGGGGTSHDFDAASMWVEKHHPGTKIHSIKYYPLLEGYSSLLEQIPKVIEQVRQTQEKYSLDDYILISHSQGGAIARALLEKMDDHRVGTWIGLASVVTGVYGASILQDLPGRLKFLENKTEYELTKIFYEPKWQNSLSFANYWVSPLEYDDYLEYNKLLPILNNETYHSNSSVFKNNFLKVNKMVFFGSPHDGAVFPWQSLHWGFYEHGSLSKIVPMEEQSWYVSDSFGLRTLNERGAIELVTVPGVKHIEWVFSKKVFVENVIPYLD